MLILGTCLAAVVLLAAGTAIGDTLAGGGPSAPAGNHPSRTRSTTPGTTPGPSLPPPGAFPPPGVVPGGVTGKPAVAMNQPTGDGDTTFVVIGAGFAPGAPLTVRLVGVGVSPDHPKADNAGFVNYAINQSHEFFPGPLPPGSYQVVVTAPGGIRRTATFTVNSSPLPPGPG